jgi:hypothetical protein
MVNARTPPFAAFVLPPARGAMFPVHANEEDSVSYLVNSVGHVQLNVSDMPAAVRDATDIPEGRAGAAFGRCKCGALHRIRSGLGGGREGGGAPHPAGRCRVAKTTPAAQQSRMALSASTTTSMPTTSTPPARWSSAPAEWRSSQMTMPTSQMSSPQLQRLSEIG